MAVKKKVTSKSTTSKKKAVVKKPAAKKKVVAQKSTVKKKVVAQKSTAKKKVAVKKSAVKATKKVTASAKKKAAVKEVVAKKSPSSPKKTVAVKNSVTKTSAVSAKPKPVVKQHKPSPIDNIPLIESYNEKEGEDYMNAAQRRHFREILNNWKHELMQEVDRTVGYMKDEAANFPDPADRATQEEEFNLELRTRDRERKLIKKIDEALQRLEDNDYGYCEACGVEIGSKRLEARPTATLCIDCKTVDEIREKQLLA